MTEEKFVCGRAYKIRGSDTDIFEAKARHKRIKVEYLSWNNDNFESFIWKITDSWAVFFINQI